MKKGLLLFFAALCSVVHSQQGLKENFTPLKSSGQLPAIFTQQTRGEIEKDLKDLKTKKEKDRSLRSNFLTASGYQVEKIVRSGDMLMNDEITRYLNQIADEILKDDPALRKQLSIYTLKSSVVNAYSFDKGYIFIDIGLIAQAETEAQLAFILCHEIMHYTKRHNINSYINSAKIDRKNYSHADRLVEKCQYSKENESEADIEGFKLYEQTKYNIKQAEASFDMLQYAHLPFELVRFKKAFFETPGYAIPNYYFLKEEAPIRDNSHEDDALQTHPNTARRKLAINNLSVGKDNTGKVNSLVGQERFEYIRDLSRMEICRLYLKRRDYPNALYAAYILAAKYPDNQYLAEVISKSLYGVTLFRNGIIHYTEDSYVPKGISNYEDIEGFPQQIYYMINKMPANEWTFLTLNYTYRAHKKFPANKKLNELCDSLFALTGKVSWGISDFSRSVAVQKKDSLVKPEMKDTTAGEAVSRSALIASIQKETQARTEDTVYYKNMFADLFTSDAEFAKRFPSHDVNTVSAFKTYSQYSSASRQQKQGGKTKAEMKIDKVLIVEPMYADVDKTASQSFKYFSSDKKQEDYVGLLNSYSRRLNMGLSVLDPGLIGSGDVDKINDYSVLNDWLDERLDSEDRDQPILNTDDTEGIIARYGTPYILKTGIANLKTANGSKRTFFFSFLVDIRNNKLIYYRYEVFKTKDYRDMVHAKTYQLLFDMNHPIKTK